MTSVVDCSPEQSSEVGERINCSVNHEWIYRYVARGKARSTGTFAKAINVTARDTTASGVIPNHVSIDELPAIGDERSRVGDRLVVTVLDRQGCGASLVERKSRLYLVRFVLGVVD